VLTYADDIAIIAAQQDSSRIEIRAIHATILELRLALDSVKRTSESLKLMRCMDTDVPQQQMGLVQIECPPWTVQGRMQKNSFNPGGSNGLPPSYPKSTSWWMGSELGSMADAPVRSRDVK
jgi:hypothetical protein